jgi:hypothetical protein
MRLAQCIQANMEAILVQWEDFAHTLYPAAAHLTSRMLRDHAQQILAAVVADLSTPQTDEQQSEKSMGRAPRIWNAPETAALGPLAEEMPQRLGAGGAPAAGRPRAPRTLGTRRTNGRTPARRRRAGTASGVLRFLRAIPGVSLRSTPGYKLSSLRLG